MPLNFEGLEVTVPSAVGRVERTQRSSRRALWRMLVLRYRTLVSSYLAHVPRVPRLTAQRLRLPLQDPGRFR